MFKIQFFIGCLCVWNRCSNENSSFSKTRQKIRSIEQIAGFSIARLDYRKLFREVTGTTTGLPLPIIYGARGVDDVRYMEPQHLQSVAHTIFDHGSSECSEMSLSSSNSSFLRLWICRFYGIEYPWPVNIPKLLWHAISCSSVHSHWIPCAAFAATASKNTLSLAWAQSAVEHLQDGVEIIYSKHIVFCPIDSLQLRRDGWRLT